MKISRRSAMTIAGGSLLSAWGAGSPRGDDQVCDVAVVGGGVSGIYVAWRLLTANSSTKAQSVSLFEASDRIGGRMHSTTPPGAPHLRAEMGAMRFPTTHKIVAGIVQHLGLETRPFPVNGANNLFYLRGQRFRQKEWGDIHRASRYGLESEDAAKSVDELLIQAIERYVPDAQRLDAQAWQNVKQQRRALGMPLHQVPFEQLLLTAKGGEVLRIIRDAGGYDSFYKGWNAGEMMSWIMADFWGSPSYLTLRDGYDALPRRLALEAQQAGAEINFHHSLRSVSTTEDHGERLLRLTFKIGDNHREVLARKVVLAMPRRAIEGIDRSSFFFTESFSSDLRAVTAQQAAKCFLLFPKPWWSELGIQAGRSVTDLPIRQCYYMGAECEQRGADKQNQHALLMIYSDDRHAAFWNCLARSAGTTAGAGSANPWRSSCRDPIVKELVRQVKDLHGEPGCIEEPAGWAHADWSRAPFGGAWHFWNANTKPWEVIPRIRQPVAGTDLFVCGEAWSTDQGWVRGALTNAERLLQTKFDLPAPQWLASDEYLGA